MRIANVVGARPQFIKAAVMLHGLRRSGLESLLIHTGQHYDFEMSQVFFDELQIPAPDYNLGIRAATHGVQTGQMLAAIEAVLSSVKPDLVIVYGDTNSTLAGALAAAKLHLTLAHVEAGLRSFNRGMPEEINRIVSDHVSDMLFAPTSSAVRNLLHEGIESGRIFQAGDLMFDAALRFGSLAEERSKVLHRLKLSPKSFLLVTIHRAENTDDPVRLSAIAKALPALARDISIVFPVHPRTRDRLQKDGLFDELARSVTVVEPLGYLDMITLQRNAKLIATDSGGMQKEAFFYGTPCVTLRAETEWTELVENGWNRLLPPTTPEHIMAGLKEALDWDPILAVNPYGDGNSSNIIAEIIAGLEVQRNATVDLAL